VDTTQTAVGTFAGFGGLVDFTATLQHVGFLEPQVVFDRVLSPQTFICISGLAGSYTFRSGEPTTLQSQCGTGTDLLLQNKVIPPGTYRTTSPDDDTDSNLSSFWNGQRVAGTWRLFVSDVNDGTGPGQFVMNTNWTWQLDIEVADGIPPMLMGDINDDTVIDAVDAQLLLEGLVGLPPAINFLAGGDVNADDAIDNLDSVVIVAIGLGLAPDPSLINAFGSGNNILTVIGQANAVPPGSPVNLLNTTTNGPSTPVIAATDGSFRGQLPGSVGNTIVVDINGSLARVAIPVQPSVVGEGPALGGVTQ